MKQLLIFDLDDTIFATKSIGEKAIKPIFENFKILLSKEFGDELVQQIIKELWKFPFDFISDKYQFTKSLNKEFVSLINRQEYNFDIKVFQDFRYIESLNQEKILVTTGFSKLQNAKIEQLGIKDSFSEIYIDEIFDSERIFKKGIFEMILSKRKIEAKQVYVIGDNPNSELKAGFNLGMNTIQLAKFGQAKSVYSTNYIIDYKQLIEILNN